MRLAAPGRRGGRCDGDLAAELIGRAGLALTDAFDLGRVQRIDLGATLAVILQADLAGETEQRAETRLESIVAVDLAADVADDAVETGAQELELAPGALELMGLNAARTFLICAEVKFPRRAGILRRRLPNQMY
jgi:hypothetical protein